MTKSRFKVSVDVEADAAYITMSDSPVVNTVQVTDGVLVDLDALRVVVGIEVLRINADIPFQRLIDEYHVHSDDVELLRLLRPNVGAAFSLRQGSDGVASPAREGILVASN
jgi:uncharacterized protein YuzE